MNRPQLVARSFNLLPKIEHDKPIRNSFVFDFVERTKIRSALLPKKVRNDRIVRPAVFDVLDEV